MKIKKMYQGTVPENKILNTRSDSQTDVYSCDYVNNLKRVLYEGNPGILMGMEGTKGGVTTMNNMPALQNYIGKEIEIFVAYHSDLPKSYKFIYTGDKAYHILYTRNFNGNDVWLVSFGFSNIGTTTWKASCDTATIISGSSISEYYRNTYRFYITKIVVYE